MVPAPKTTAFCMGSFMASLKAEMNAATGSEFAPQPRVAQVTKPAKQGQTGVLDGGAGLK
jgi:hypothetical protein